MIVVTFGKYFVKTPQYLIPFWWFYNHCCKVAVTRVGLSIWQKKIERRKWKEEFFIVVIVAKHAFYKLNFFKEINVTIWFMYCQSGKLSNTPCSICITPAIFKTNYLHLFICVNHFNSIIVHIVVVVIVLTLRLLAQYCNEYFRHRRQPTLPPGQFWPGSTGCPLQCPGPTSVRTQQDEPQVPTVIPHLPEALHWSCETFLVALHEILFVLIQFSDHTEMFKILNLNRRLESETFPF